MPKGDSRIVTQSISDRLISQANGNIPKPKSWKKSEREGTIGRYKTARAKYRAHHDPEHRKTANRIRRLRKLLGQSQAEFAFQFGIRRREINRWESAYHRPNLDCWQRFTDLEKMARKVVEKAKRDGRTPNFSSLTGEFRTKKKEKKAYGDGRMNRTVPAGNRPRNYD